MKPPKKPTTITGGVAETPAAVARGVALMGAGASTIQMKTQRAKNRTGAFHIKVSEQMFSSDTGAGSTWSPPENSCGLYLELAGK